MASKNDCVWFRNKLTGNIDGVPRGSEAHRRMTIEAVEDKDGVPALVWEEIKAPKTSTVPYKSGMQAQVFLPREVADEDEEPEPDPGAGS